MQKSLQPHLTLPQAAKNTFSGLKATSSQPISMKVHIAATGVIPGHAWDQSRELLSPHCLPVLQNTLAKTPPLGAPILPSVKWVRGWCPGPPSPEQHPSHRCSTALLTQLNSHFGSWVPRGRLSVSSTDRLSWGSGFYIRSPPEWTPREIRPETPPAEGGKRERAWGEERREGGRLSTEDPRASKLSPSCLKQLHSYSKQPWPH